MKFSFYSTVSTLLLFIFWGSAFAQENSGKVLTLEACIEYAMEHNTSVQNASLDIQSAEAKIQETVGLGLPQVNGSVDLGYNFKVPTSFIPAKLFDPTAQEGEFMPVQFGTEYNGSANISVNQMVFRGSYFVGLKAAKTYRELAQKESHQTKEQVVESVSKAYYSALITSQRLALVKNNYARLDSLYKETELMYSNGFAEKIDLSRLKISLNNLKADLNNTDDLVALSFNLLKFQMGMPINEEISIEDNLESMTVRLEYEKPEVFNVENHIDYQVLFTSRELTLLDVRNVQSQYYPSVDLYGTYGANMGSNQASDYFNFNDRWFTMGVVGLRMQIPLFDGMQKSKIIQQKRVQISQIENNFKNLKNSIELSLQTSIVEYNKSIENMLAQKENLELAEEIYKVSNIKYKQGIGSNIEVINAESAYKEAQTNYYNALYDAIIAKIDLDKIYGKLTVTENEDE